MDILREKRGKHEKAFIICDQECVTEFIQYQKDSKYNNIRQMAIDLGICYDMLYSFTTGRRNPSMGSFLTLLDGLGYNMMLIPKSLTKRVTEEGADNG